MPRYTATRRGLWLKRKAGLEPPEERPRKLSRQHDSAQDLVSSPPSALRSNSMDTRNVAENSDTSEHLGGFYVIPHTAI